MSLLLLLKLTKSFLRDLFLPPTTQLLIAVAGH